jgi:hypothetical protein
VLYLIIDAYLNVYFIRTVKANLVSNGLQKYNRLVNFNLLMDIVVLGTMSLPNGLMYVMSFHTRFPLTKWRSYTILHPLAYLVKLNIEMSMARLIKKIALGFNNPNNAVGFRSFTSSNGHKSSSNNGSLKTWAARKGTTLKSIFNGNQHPPAQEGVIQMIEEFTVRSAPRADMKMQPQGILGDKTVQVAVTAIKGDAKEKKTSRTKGAMGDEENLIKGHQHLYRIVGQKTVQAPLPWFLTVDKKCRFRG